MSNNIVIRGARENNLKNIDLTIPRDKLIVFTGLSGSGKSTLAFDTIYAEGQRRYVESLSAYARQFLGQMDKPDVEYIEGLSPAISIDQKTTSHNPRSTVGTVTEIYDYLRLLFARVGTVHCHICGREISKVTIQEIVNKIMEYEDGTKIILMSPIVRGKKGTHKKILENIQKDGYVRVRVDGQIYDINEELNLDKNKKHDVEVIIDRLKIKSGIEARLYDSIETAINLSEGLLLCDINGKNEIFTTDFACPEHGSALSEVSPRLFSFNAPFGACPECKGLGERKMVDVDLVVPNDELSLKQGAIEGWGMSSEDGYYYKMIEAMAKKYDISMDIPFKELPEEFKQKILYSENEEEISFIFDSRYSGRKKYTGLYEGVIPNLQRRYNETSSDKQRDRIEEFMVEMPCPICKGKRLKDEVLAITVGDKDIIQVTDLSIEKLIAFLDNLTFSQEKSIISSEIVKEIRARASFLKDVGLGYLTLSRKAGSLSGGEAQRIRLATQIGSALVGVLYVLDEPSIGLHQRDNDKLISTLRNLTDIGNTLIVVEHDEDTIRTADYIVDIGPKAGIHGGEIVAQGSVEDIINNKNSLTGLYLSGKRKISIPKKTRDGNGKYIVIHGASENNLKNINVDIPLGKFICITGVSGSGKSTLVNEILYKGVASQIYKRKLKPGKHKSISGIENIDKIIVVDQSPIGRTPHSNPATYTGVFDHIRDLFASVPQAKAKGYTKSRFSFNLKGGRCEACKGHGIKKIEMHFLPDVYVPCEVCNGSRYNSETLNVKYKDKSISDVLNMNIEEAIEFFENIPSINRILQTLMDVGLNYIKLGQPSTQLSGGEAQRVKLASELSKRSTGKTLYILDEPTTGLHMYDVDNLINVIQRLADSGNTVMVIEHNLDVIKCCDHIIDLGPEGGEKGGTLLFSGTPKEIIKCKNSYTGEFLNKIWNNNV